MRIIAGMHRGRRLLPPSSEATRPITDRVKQSLFDVIAPLLEDAVIYDVFAGTGSLGLECLSRGARRAEFFEADRSALALLRRNIADLRLDNRSIVRPGDVFSSLGAGAREVGAARQRAAADSATRANLIFLDPPYRYLRERPDELRSLTSLMVCNHLAPGGSIILRHDANDHLELDKLAMYDRRDYGGMVIDFFAAAPPATAQNQSSEPIAADIPPAN